MGHYWQSSAGAGRPRPRPARRFALRRILHLTLLRPNRRSPPLTRPSAPPRSSSSLSATSPTIPGLCAALDALDYPRPRWQVAPLTTASDDLRQRRHRSRRDPPGWQACICPPVWAKLRPSTTAWPMSLWRNRSFDGQPPATRLPALGRAAFADARGRHQRAAGGNALASPPLITRPSIPRPSTGHPARQRRVAPGRRCSVPTMVTAAPPWRNGRLPAGAFLEDSDLTRSPPRRIRHSLRAAGRRLHRVPPPGYIRQHSAGGAA